jgi:hypothetical protein
MRARPTRLFFLFIQKFVLFFILAHGIRGDGGTGQPTWDHPHHLIQSFSLPLSKTYIIRFGDLELALKIEILVIIFEKDFSLLMRQVSMFSPFGFSIQ